MPYFLCKYFVCKRGPRHRVIALSTKGVAAQHSARRQIQTFEHTVHVNCFGGVRTTAGRVAAGVWTNTSVVAIPPKYGQDEALHDRPSALVRLGRATDCRKDSL